MLDRCQHGSHIEADIDERVIAFYADLTSELPDHPPYDLNRPWSFMYLRFGPVSDPVIDLVQRLAVTLPAPEFVD